ncbi:MAG TPA: hypothetical protein VGE08_02040 [Steroidobacter sp.]|uniref:hypothetical protein n=1 Tax=Steroidobacter sp. TaxID=1978227 RepID=UPI002ED9DB47
MTTLESQRAVLDPTSSATDEATMRAFEQGTLDPAQFSHRQHLALAWRYLQRDGFPEGAQQFRYHLQRYVASVGAEGKYHETVTWAYLVLLNEERCLRSPPGESFEAMIQRRADLLDHRNGAIMRCYSKSQLDSPEARRVFMLPAVPTGDERG